MQEPLQKGGKPGHQKENEDETGKKTAATEEMQHLPETLSLIKEETDWEIARGVESNIVYAK